MTWWSARWRSPYSGHGMAPLIVVDKLLHARRCAAPRFRVALVSDTVFNLPGAQPASIYDLLWQRDATTSTFRFTGAMLNPKRAKHTACSHWTAGAFGAKATPSLLRSGYNLLYPYSGPARQGVLCPLSVELRLRSRRGSTSDTDDAPAETDLVTPGGSVRDRTRHGDAAPCACRDGTRGTRVGNNQTWG